MPDFSPQYSFDVQPGLTEPVYAPAYYPHAINDVGTIAGSYMLRGQSSGFTYDTRTETVNINVVPPIPGNGTTFSHLGGINDRSTLAGWVFGLSGGTSTGLLVNNGSASTFTYPNSLSTQALGVNNFGQVAGFHADGSGTAHGFSGTPGHLTSFDVPGAASTEAEAINDWGQIVGSYTDSGGATHGFVDRSGHFTTVDIPGATATSLSGINDWAQLVGSYTDSSGAGHGFVQSFGRVQTLDAPGATRTNAYGINNLGEVVGTAEITTTDPGGGAIPGSEVWVAKPSFLQGNDRDPALRLAAAAGLPSPSDGQSLSSLLQAVRSDDWSHAGPAAASVAGAAASASPAGGLDNAAATLAAFLTDQSHGAIKF